jgi:hypothetical protein
MTSHPDHPPRAAARERGTAPARPPIPALRSLAALVFAAAAAVGCAPLSGTTSLTVLSADHLEGIERSAYFDEETACTNWLLTLFGWGDPSSHETLVARLLERTSTDVLAEAKLESSTWGFPYVFMRTCTSVTARPSKRIARTK